MLKSELTDVSKSGPISTITIAVSSFIGVLLGGTLSDRWVQKNLRGRVYTGAIGLGMTIPSLLLLGCGHHIVAVVGAGLCSVSVSESLMQTICRSSASLSSAKQRATAYGVMNMIGVFAGAFITDLLGQWSDGGDLGLGFSMLAIVVAAALCAQLTSCAPKPTMLNN